MAKPGRSNAERKSLVAFAAGGNAESYSALFVGLGSRGQVEVRERNLLRVLRSEVPQRLPNNRVVVYSLLMLIAEPQHRIRQNRRTFGLTRHSARRHRTGVGILIAVGLLLPHHLLLFEILPVHFSRISHVLTVAV